MKSWKVYLSGGVFLAVIGGLSLYWVANPWTPGESEAGSEQDVSSLEESLTGTDGSTGSEGSETQAPKSEPEPMPEKTIHFAFDSSRLGGDSRMVLDQWAQRLTANKGLSVRIEGHCDARGPEWYNDQLGERRAESAKDYLVSAGVSPQRIKTISYGESQPAVQGSGEDVWSQNRRVHIGVMNALSQK